MQERLQAEQVPGHGHEELIVPAGLAVLGRLSAEVVHELNQPLAALRAMAGNALVRLERAEPEAARQNLLTIVGLIERMARITGQINSIARGASASVQPVSLKACISNALALVEPRINAEQVAVEVGLSTESAVVSCDPDRLEQVLVNLFNNALDAMSGRCKCRLWLIVRQDAQRVSIHVCDNGPGIPAQLLPRVLEPFFTTKKAGLGLGLAISDGIIREFGGTLVPGNCRDGAEFIINLPRQPATANPEEPEISTSGRY